MRKQEQGVCHPAELFARLALFAQAGSVLFATMGVGENLKPAPNAAR
jgi:hypothetical protein